MITVPRLEIPAATAPRVPGYGRARLWVGMSAVGTFVVLSAAGLALGVPAAVEERAGPGIAGQAAALAGFVAAYALVHLPFDLFGGYLLPRRFGRAHPPAGRYLAGLGRGVAGHAALLLAAAAGLTAAGRYGGTAGTAAAGVGLVLMLLRGRVAVAAVLAPLDLTPAGAAAALPVRTAASPDEGFTGAVVGVFRPRGHILPVAWRAVLGPEGFAAAARRRDLAVLTGSWKRGRVLAVLFTLAGVGLSAALVGLAALGTAGGTIALSFWFTLWSFAGLLILPTFSRRGVAEVDDRARADGTPDDLTRANARALDQLQDGEADRPALIEAIFHPIPSLRNRADRPPGRRAVGFWDAARTAVYLGPAGLGLLGRAVHCNCGRPALWAFLPVD